MNAAWPLGELDTHIVGLIRGYACRRGFFCCVLLISSLFYILFNEAFSLFKCVFNQFYTEIREANSCRFRSIW